MLFVLLLWWCIHVASAFYVVVVVAFPFIMLFTNLTKCKVSLIFFSPFRSPFVFDFVMLVSFFFFSSIIDSTEIIALNMRID